MTKNDKCYIKYLKFLKNRYFVYVKAIEFRKNHNESMVFGLKLLAEGWGKNARTPRVRGLTLLSVLCRLFVLLRAELCEFLRQF